MQKKGAIEFSMTTIMVIIIGVAVLALGLVWIRGAFRDVGDITNQAFESARTNLAGDLGPDNQVIVSPSSVSLGANNQVTVSIGCYNDATTSQSAVLESIAGTNVVVSQSTNPSSTIDAGSEAYWGLVLKANSGVNSATQPEVLTLNINCNGGGVEARPLTVTYK